MFGGSYDRYRKYEPGQWSNVMDCTENSRTRVKSRVKDELTYATFGGSISETCKHMKETEKYYKEQGYSDIEIEEKGWGEDKSYHYYGWRAETDEEFAARLLALDKMTADQKEHDLKELEVIKKRLGM